MPRTTLPLLSAAFLAAAPLIAQQPAPQSSSASANARAEARAEANGSGPQSSQQRRTVTHRVVVRNGRKVVDERTENGKPVPAGNGNGRSGMPDAEAMLRRMREQMQRELRQLPDLEGSGGERMRKLREQLERELDEQVDKDSRRARGSRPAAPRPRLRAKSSKPADRDALDAWRQPVPRAPRAKAATPKVSSVKAAQPKAAAPKVATPKATNPQVRRR